MYINYTDGGDYPEVFYPVQGGGGKCADVERDARKNAGAPNEDDPQIAARWGVVMTQALCMVRDGRQADADALIANWFNKFDEENAS